MIRFGWFESCLVCFLALFGSALTVVHFSDTDSLMQQIAKQARREGQAMKQREIVRKKLIMSYEEWQSLVENPGSENSQVALEKTQAVCGLGENSVFYSMIMESLTDEEAKAYHSFWSHFSLDINSLRPAEKEPAELFNKLVAPLLVELQIELLLTYRRPFDHSNLSAGEKLTIFMHFAFRSEYIQKKGRERTF